MMERHLASFATTRTDNPMTQTGIRSEFTYRGIRFRRGRKRADTSHHWIDQILVAGPWLVPVGTAVAAIQGSRHRSDESAE